VVSGFAALAALEELAAHHDCGKPGGCELCACDAYHGRRLLEGRVTYLAGETVSADAADAAQRAYLDAPLSPPVPGKDYAKAARRRLEDFGSALRAMADAPDCPLDVEDVEDVIYPVHSILG
jgi:hypothetical protein